MPRIVIALRLTEGRANEAVPKAGDFLWLMHSTEKSQEGGIYDKV